MSSISSTTTAQRWSSPVSPQTRMSDTISSELSAGSLSSTDATALTSALSSIGSSLSADATNAASGTTTQAKLDPSSMKDRIDSLIADQVSSGSLTDDQATELKTLFASHGQSTQTADASAEEGGVSGAGGPPPGPPPGSPSDGAARGGASSASGSTDTSSTGDLLASFLQQVQSSQSSTAGYGASGTNTSTNTAALLFDFQS